MISPKGASDGGREAIGSARQKFLRELAQAAHAIFDMIVPAMPGAQTQAIAKAPASREDVAGSEADALLERLAKERT